MKNDLKKAIELTDTEYKILVKLLFYGEWILNANKSKSEEMDKESSEFMEYIFQKKNEFNLSNWFKNLEYGEEFKEAKTMELLEKMFEYNEETFLFYLKEKLAFRDAEQAYYSGNPGNKSVEDLKFEFELKYEQAFEKDGINRLYLKPQKGVASINRGTKSTDDF